jgi:hypothetical protein
MALSIDYIIFRKSITSKNYICKNLSDWCN